jgi:hypothetical protein
VTDEGEESRRRWLVGFLIVENRVNASEKCPAGSARSPSPLRATGSQTAAARERAVWQSSRSSHGAPIAVVIGAFDAPGLRGPYAELKC